MRLSEANETCGLYTAKKTAVTHLKADTEEIMRSKSSNRIGIKIELNDMQLIIHQSLAFSDA
jgi:hypothetical protein